MTVLHKLCKLLSLCQTVHLLNNNHRGEFGGMSTQNMKHAPASAVIGGQKTERNKVCKQKRRRTCDMLYAHHHLYIHKAWKYQCNNLWSCLVAQIVVGYLWWFHLKCPLFFWRLWSLITLRLFNIELETKELRFATEILETVILLN